MSDEWAMAMNGGTEMGAGERWGQLTNEVKNLCPTPPSLGTN